MSFAMVWETSTLTLLFKSTSTCSVGFSRVVFSMIPCCEGDTDEPERGRNGKVAEKEMMKKMKKRGDE